MPAAKKQPSPLSFDCGLDAALYLAERGFPVFPMTKDPDNPKAFIPAVKRFYEAASDNPDRVRKMFGYRDPSSGTWKDRGHGVAISTTHLMVIDLDNKDGKAGTDNFADWVDTWDVALPRTLTIRTPSGGTHLVYQTENPIKCTSSQIADGVDTRGWHGYIATVGTQRHDGTYTIVDDAAPAPAPDLEGMVSSVLGAPKQRSRQETALDTYIDEKSPEYEDAVDRAIEFMRETETDEYGGYNYTTLQVAMRCGDYGLRPDVAEYLMDEYWADKPAHRGLKPNEIRNVVRNAYEYRDATIGHRTEAYREKTLIEDFGPPQYDNDNIVRDTKSAEPVPADPEDDFAPVDPDEIPDAPEAKPDPKPDPTEDPFSATTVSAFDPDSLVIPRTRRHLVKGLVPYVGVGHLYGAPGARKSQIAFDLGIAVASGQHWQGYRVREQRGVIISSNEAAADAVPRLKASLLGREIKDPIPLAVTTAGFSIGKLNGFLKYCRAQQKRMGCKLGLIVIDNLLSHCEGIDITDPERATLVRNHIRELAKRLDAFVLVVNHTTKSAESMYAPQVIIADGDLRLKAEAEPDSPRLTRLDIEKNRQGEQYVKHYFTGEVHNFGEDEDGDPITAPYVKEHERRQLPDAPDIPVDPDDVSHWDDSVAGRLGYAMYQELKVRPQIGWTAIQLHQICAAHTGVEAPSNDTIRKTLNRLTRPNASCDSGMIKFRITKHERLYQLDIVTDLSKTKRPKVSDPETDFADNPIDEPVEWLD